MLLVLLSELNSVIEITFREQAGTVKIV